jgi:alkyldihydroxyacetonephosphate synthase
MRSLDENLAELKGAADSPEILRNPEDLEKKSHDWWVRGRLARRVTDRARADAVVRPKTAAQVSVTLAWAQRTQTPIVPFGLGSGVCGAIQAERGQVVLDLSAMNRILDLNEESLTVVAQPGMRGSDFEGALSSRGYTMGHFPQSIELSTLGGWCSTRAAGQFSTLYGNIEDMLIGCEVVVPGGEIWRLPATVRASVGPDLKNVFLGSEGTLGVFTELTFRIHPRPEHRAGQSFRLPDLAAGIEILRRTMRAGWRPAVTRLYDAIEAGRNFRVQCQGLPVLLLLSEGPAGLVEAEEKAVAAIASEHGATPMGPEPVDSWLEHRNQVPDVAALIDQGLVVDTIEVAAGWDRVTELFESVCSEGAAVPGMIAMSGHVSHCYTQGANIYFTFVASESDPKRAIELYDRVWSLTMRHTHRVGGTIAHHHGIGRVRKAYLGEELGASVELIRRLKRAIDPLGIMNPGVLLD